MMQKEDTILTENSDTPRQLQQMLRVAQQDQPSASQWEALVERLELIDSSGLPVSATKTHYMLPMVGMVATLIIGLLVWAPWRISEVSPLQQPIRPVPTPTPTLVYDDDGTTPGPNKAQELSDATPSKVNRGQDSPPSELHLVRKARGALQALNWSLALRYARLHRRHYKAGVLAEEREAIALEALWRLGKRQHAKQKLRAFRAAHANSAYLPHLELLLEQSN